MTMTPEIIPGMPGSTAVLEAMCALVDAPLPTNPAEDDALAERLLELPAIVYSEMLNLHVVTRHADALHISRNRARFTSAYGTLLFMRHAPPEQPAQGEGESGGFNHRVISTLGRQSFGKSRMAIFERIVNDVVKRSLDDLDPHEMVDLMPTLTARIPADVIGAFLGMPQADWPLLRQWIPEAEHLAERGLEGLMAQFGELGAYFQNLVADKRRSGAGGEDTISFLLEAHANDEPEQLDEDIAALAGALAFAGLDNTRLVLNQTVRLMAEHPEERARVAADLSLVPSAIEEVLRSTPALTEVGRTVLEADHVSDHEFRRGDFVLMNYKAINRDRSVFGETAHRFDVTRQPNPHLSFGFGVERCVGAPLAQLEAQAFLHQLLERYPRYEVNGPLEYWLFGVQHQLKALPVRLS